MRFFFIFTIYLFGVIFYFVNQYKTNLENYHTSLLHNAKTILETSINAFEISNDNFHSTNADIIAKILSQTPGASTNKRDALREELKKKFTDFYHAKELDSIEGMNIIDRDGRVLLRFHALERYDDILTDKRYSVAQMQKDFLYKKGLEFGIYKESFRFQYPLFYDGKYVGMYEYSVGFDVFMREMQKFFAQHYMFWFKSAKIDSIVISEIIGQRYKKMYLDETSVYVKKLFTQEIVSEDKCIHILSLQALHKAIASDSISVIDYSYESTDFSLIVMPIADISGENVAYMLADVPECPRYHYMFHALFEGFVAIVLALLFFWVYYLGRKNQLYMKNLLDLHHEMLIVTDGKELKNANKRFLDFFGYKKLKVFKRDHSCICDFFIKEERYLQKEKDGSSWIEYVLKHPEKEMRVKMLNAHTNEARSFVIHFEVFDNTHNVFLSFRDITEELSQNELLKQKAFYDTLTQTYNRTSFNEYLQKEMEKAERYGARFSLLMFDIDYFKMINDTYGHDIGDDVLKQLSSLIKRHIREADIFARWGGEEFMIISHTDLAETEQMAEKLRLIIEDYNFGPFDITCSFGVTQYRDGESTHELLKRCDVLLYSAKESGRNCVVAFH